MKKALLDFLQGRRSAPFRMLAGLMAAFFLAGCTAITNSVPQLVPDYKPTNIYRQGDMLPPQIRRVAVLPLTTAAPTALLQAGVEDLQTILYAELEKSGRFEVYRVSGEQLREWTGQSSWKADEQLPHNFLERLQESTGSDAVLFSQLIRYQPYEPMAIGWKFSLVEKTVPAPPKAAGVQILWSADEIFDAGDVAVANAAKTYYSQHLRNETPAADSATILGSPSRFGQYTLSALFATLPARQNH